MTVDEAFQLGVQHHRANRLAEAEALYRQVLAAQPRHAGALHLLGVMAGQVGRADVAVDLIRRAIALQPGEGFFHINLGKFLMDQGKQEEAAAAFREAARVQPALPEAQAHLGAALRLEGKLEQASSCLLEALRLKADCVEALTELGNVRFAQGRAQESIACFREVVRLHPMSVDAHVNLSAALKGMGQLDEAVAHGREALRLKPDYPAALANLAGALQSKGQLEEALALFQRRAALEPANNQAHADVGGVMMALARFGDAIAAYRQAVACRPMAAAGHNNLGVALQTRWQVDEAIRCFRTAVSLYPEYADAHSNLGYALKDIGKLSEAAVHTRRAMELQPDDPDPHSNLLFALQFDPACSAATLLAECRRWNGRHAAPLRRYMQPHENDRTLERPLRVGFVSPDFRAHCQSFFTLPLFSAHDRRAVHFTAYSDVALVDDVTARLQGQCDAWRNIVGMSDEQVAALIRRDRIDILVDLTMHMGRNRLRVFARKPAPVQASWLAYPGTTGVEAIDYRLTDPYLDPPGTEGRYAEQSVRLPETFWCYDPLTEVPVVNALPAMQGEPFTFGCLNNFCKINDGVLGLWGEVLRAVGKSRLLLLAPEGSAREHIAQFFAQQGVMPERIVFVSRQERSDYLRIYHHMDVGLETVPYNGHTTSLDSYWMGVPVITISGPTVVGRAGVSQLRNLGLPELIAESPADYVRIVVGLARDLQRLSALRASLRERMARSPLMDAARFARGMEAAFRQMWIKWCAGKPG